jgi:putative intracellular protease/amidase
MKHQASRADPKQGEKKTSFHETEAAAWSWLQQWAERPNYSDVPSEFREAAGIVARVAGGLLLVVGGWLLVGAQCCGWKVR